MEQTIELTHDILATKGQRLANYIIDYAIRLLAGYLLGLTVGLMYTYLDIATPYYWITGMGRIGEFVLGYVIAFIYYTIFEGTLQCSPAKFITGTKVVAFDGSKPLFSTMVKRSLCRMIPFDAFSFLGEPDKGWHDSISETYVVNIKKYNEAMYLKTSFNEIGEAAE